MDPSANAPYHFLGAAAEAFEPAPQLQPAATADNPVTELTVTSPVAAPIEGEVLPPEAPAPETPPSPQQYPIGLIDFNLPIVVLDNADYNEETYDNPAIIAVLKGSVHPVVVTFWKHGEQCVEQFDTDGDSASGDYKIEQELAYPVTRFVVVGRDGRNLVVDEELYVSDEAARAETTIDDVAGVFPVVIEAPAPTIADDVAGVDRHVGDEHGGEEDESALFEQEEDENEVAAAPAAPTPETVPTEMYVAGRMRRVGDTVHACRGGITRVCTITKLRNNATKSLCLHPHDGSPDYWAWNKNVRY